MATTPQRIVLASGNPGKLRELAAILAACRTRGTESENQPARGQICDGLPLRSGSIGQKPARAGTAQADLQPVLHTSDRLPTGQPLELVAQADLGVDDAEETGLTFVENALLKARHAARVTGLPALADDSGLCVDALAGAPGLYSARYAGVHGDHAANNARLLREMEGIEDADRGAFFICVIALLRHAEDPAPLLAEGRWHGRILSAPAGSGGFGYDPLFQPDGQSCSAAQMDAAEKNRSSHRGLALAALRQRLPGAGLGA